MMKTFGLIKVLSWLALLALALSPEMSAQTSGQIIGVDSAEDSPELPRHGIVAKVIGVPTSTEDLRVNAVLLVPSPCVDVDYAISHDSDYHHYVDYFFDATGDNCGPEQNRSEAILNFGKLAPGVHTITFVGPEWNEFILEFIVEGGLRDSFS